MSAVDFENWPYPAFAAHRGAGTLAPENTLAAMRAGFDCGYRMFEFDVKLSGDGVAILMHDSALGRTTDGHGRVADMNWSELARLDAGSWHSARYAGEPVPTLARIARWLRANECLADIEIKPCPGRETETGAAVMIESLMLWREARTPPLVSSFSETALEAAREVAPHFPRALLFECLSDDWLDRCRALGCVALGASHRALEPPAIALARKAGLRVLAYTINDPVRAAGLRKAGLDCVITDVLDLIVPVG